MSKRLKNCFKPQRGKFTLGVPLEVASFVPFQTPTG